MTGWSIAATSAGALAHRKTVSVSELIAMSDWNSRAVTCAARRVASVAVSLFLVAIKAFAYFASQFGGDAGQPGGFRARSFHRRAQYVRHP